MTFRSAPPHRKTRGRLSVRALKALVGTSKYEPHEGKKQLRKATERQAKWQQPSSASPKDTTGTP